MTDAAQTLQSQIELLGDLAKIGLEVARAVEREANSEVRTVDIDRVAMAYARASRAVRLTVMLQSRLRADAKAIDAEAAEDAARCDPIYVRKARVERIVERIAKAEHGDDEDQIDRLVIEAGERLDDEDLYGDILDRPVGELVARICRDLDLTPDWTRLAEERWALDEMQGGEAGAFGAASPARGGGGPRSAGEGTPLFESPSRYATPDGFP